MKEVKFPSPIYGTDARMMEFLLNDALEKLGSEVRVEYNRITEEMTVKIEAREEL